MSVEYCLALRSTDCPGAFESIWLGYYSGVGGQYGQFGGIFWKRMVWSGFFEVSWTQLWQINVTVGQPSQKNNLKKWVVQEIFCRCVTLVTVGHLSQCQKNSTNVTAVSQCHTTCCHRWMLMAQKKSLVGHFTRCTKNAKNGIFQFSTWFSKTFPST